MTGQDTELTEFKPDGQNTATSLTLQTSKSVIMNSRDRKIESLRKT